MAIHYVTKLLEGPTQISSGGPLSFWRWPLPGELKAVHLIGTSGGFTGTWQFDLRSNGVYLFSSGRLLLTPSGTSDSKTGLSIPVVQGQTAVLELIIKMSGNMNKPLVVICEVDDGVSGGGDEGDVLGPETNNENYLPQWDGNNSKTLKNGVMLDGDVNMAANSNSRVPTQAAVKGYLDGTFEAFSEELSESIDATYGRRTILQNVQSSDYTCVLDDSGKHIYHPASDANDRTFTIPDNASVAFEVGTAITFVNMSANDLAIEIDTDTMYLAGDGDTAPRVLHQYGVATAVKLETDEWVISGLGLE